MSDEYLTPPEQNDPNGSYSFVSLGCPKNTVDSERMLGLLQLDGYQLVSEPESSDFVIVNTCGFIEQAREEFDLENRLPEVSHLIHEWQGSDYHLTNIETLWNLER